MTHDNYAPTTFDQVVVLEFYVPLTQESALRRTLDSLFYTDVIVRSCGGLASIDSNPSSAMATKHPSSTVRPDSSIRNSAATRSTA